MIHSTSRTKEQSSSQRETSNHPSSSIMRRTSVPSLRNSNSNSNSTQNNQPRSTTTICQSTNRNRPSTQTAQYVQGQQDFVPSTSLNDVESKRKKEPCLYFRRGTVIEVVTRDAPSGWWLGQYENIRGWFPSHFVGRVSHLDTGMGPNDALLKKELTSWKATMLEQQKNRMPSSSSSLVHINASGVCKKNLVSPTPVEIKGSPLRNRYSASSTSRQSMPPSITSSSNMRPASRTSSLMQQNKTESSQSATRGASPIRKSRVPLPSPPSSTCSSLIIEPSAQSSSSSSSSSSKSSSSMKLPFDWETRMDEVSRHMFDLVDACVSPSASSLHVKIHQTTSSIRALLACVPTCESHPYSTSSSPPFDNQDGDMLVDQRKTVLQVLSKLVHKGSELQLTGCVDDARFRALVNQLWVEVVAFEEIIRTTFKPTLVAKSTSPTTGKKRPLHIQHLSNLNFNPALGSSSKSIKPTTPPNSPPRDHITPRSSTNEFDQLACGLLDYQTQIIDLINAHVPSNDPEKDHFTNSIRQAQNAVFDSITHLIQVIRADKDTSSLAKVSYSTTALERNNNNNNNTCALSDKQHRQGLPSTTTQVSAFFSSGKDEPSPLLPLSPLSPQQLEFTQQHNHSMTSLKNPSTPALGGNHQHRSSAPILSSGSHQHYRDSASVNKYSSLSMGSVDALSSSVSSVGTSMSSLQSSVRLCQSFEQLERPSTSLLRKSSELFRSNNNKSNTGSINNVSSISSNGSMLSEDSQYLYDPSIPNTPATPTSSTSASQRKLPRVTTLSNLAMRYLTSSTSTALSSSSHRLSHPNQHHQHHSSHQNSLPPPPSPAISYTTYTTSHGASSHGNSLSPAPLPPSNRSDSRLLNSKSTPTFDQIKISTSQSLRNMGVASLRNISRKPRRLSNQNRRSDSAMSPPPPAPPPSSSTATTASSISTSTVNTTTAHSHQQVDPPLRLRISSSLRLRRSTDTSDQRDKAAQEQKQREEEEEEEKRTRPWYLKKVRNNSQTAFNADGQLVGASLQVLVETLTCHEDCPDQLFMRSFFYNFRLFTDSETLARILMDRFNLEPPENPETQEPLTTEEEELWESDVHVPVQLRVYNVIKNWFEAYFDIAQDRKAAQLLLAFAKTDMETAMSMPAKQMTELIELKLMSTPVTPEVDKNDSLYPLDNHHHQQQQQQQNPDTGITISPAVAAAPYPSNTVSTPIRNAFRRALAHHHHHSSSFTPSYNPSQNDSTHLSSISIHRMDPQEIANQLTLMESALFCQIPPSELMAAQKKKSAPALHVKAMVHQSTLLVYWISNTILGESDAKIRVMVIKFWIKVADACLQLNNYNTLMTIRCALNSASIARLRRTWDSVMRSTKYKAMYNTIDCVADSDRNFAMYRKCLKNATTPGLPFLGIFLSDMVFIDEGNTDHRASHPIESTQQPSMVIINFDKYMRMTQMLDQTITRFQQVPYYKLKEIKEIQRYLLECIEAGNDSNEEMIYSKSLEIEPRILEEVF